MTSGAGGARGSNSVRSQLVGRDAEVAILRQLLYEAGSGSCRVVVVEGEPGIGKTRLAQEIVERADTGGFTILQGAAEQLQVDRPFGAVCDALRVTGSSPDPYRRAIADLLYATPTISAIAVDHRYRIVEAIDDLLERETMDRPVLLLMEDVHWADASTIFALHLLSRRDGLPILFLITCRPVPRSAQLRRFLDGVVEAGARRIQLPRLDEAAVAELAAKRLGADAGPNLGRQLDRAAGNPLFVLEFIDGLAEEHLIEIRGGTADTTTNVEPPPSLRTVILRRLGFLATASLDLLRTASVLGESFSATDLAAAADLSLPELLIALEEPIAAGFVAAERDVFAFRHDVVREALYGDIPNAVRRTIHLQIGRSLADAGASAIRIAHHMSAGAASGDREAVGWLYDAALEAAPNAPGIAADLLSRAADLLPANDSQRTSLLMPAVRQLAVAGRIDEASSVAARLAPLVAGTPLQTWLDLERISLLIENARIAEASQLLQRILQATSPDNWLHVQMLALKAGIELSSGDVSNAQELIEHARPFTNAHPASGAAAMFSWVGAVDAWLRGHYPVAVQCMERALPGTQLFVGGHGQGLAMTALAQAMADRWDAAFKSFETARADLEQRGMLPYLIEQHWLLSGALFMSGQWDDALAEIGAARQLMAETGATGVAILLHPDATAFIRLQRGEGAKAREALAEMEAGPSIGLVTAFWSDPMRALVEDGLGTPDVPLQVLRRWHERITEYSYVPDFRGIGRLVVRIARSAGDDDLLRAIDRDAQEALARADGVRSVEGAALLVRGSSVGDLEALEAAVRACREGGRPFDLAEACAEAGLNLLKRGSVDEGRASVTEAFKIYEQLGAGWSGATLARDARAFGIRRGSRARRDRMTFGWDSLTSSEHRVVTLIAEGLTNGEIGERLHISRGTVATHLRSVFRKLDVSSRAQLAAEATRRLS